MSTQDEVLRSLKWWWFTHGYAPTVRELGAAVGLRSSSTTDYHLQNLEADGKIEKLPGHRGYRPVKVEGEDEPV